MAKKIEHPGIVLRRELEARGITQAAFAAHVGANPGTISEVVCGRKDISAPLALRLSRALGIDAETWLAMQAAYDLSRADPAEYRGIRRLQGAK